MKKNSSVVLQQLNKKRSSWLKATRENNFEDGILRLLSDLYPDQAHFIFELLQNAEDANATHVQFELTKEKLIVRHNGRRVFNKGDVNSITSIGQSTKKDDVNRIGKFGIGFKAVFAYSKSPQVYSGGFNFEIRDLVCPFEIPCVNKGAQETVFVLPFNNPSKPSDTCFREIKTVFESLDHTILLFLNNIESIEWNLNGEENGLAVREHISGVDQRLIKVSITNPSNNDLQEDVWFLRFQVTLEQHGNLKCSIALKLGFRKENQKELDVGKPLANQMKVVPADGRLCVFFPAEKETTGLKIYVNGPYAATIDRASIRHDHEDNRAIFKVTAQLFVEAMEHLKAAGMLTSEFLGVLPNDDDQLSPFYAVMRDAVYEALSNRALIPRLNSGHGKAEELARGPKAVTDVIGEDALEVLFDNGKTQWAAGVMQNTRADKLLGSLGMPYCGYKELIDAVEEKYNWWWSPDDEASNWLRRKNVDWLQSFYLLLLTAAKQQEREDDIGEWEIIKAQDGELFIGEGVYFPTEGDSLATELPTVSAEIFEGLKKDRKKRLQEFLEYAGVNEIGEREELQKILDHYYAKDSEKPRKKKHLEHIRRFIRWSEKENEGGLFHRYYIFKDSTEENFCQGLQCYIDKPFEETGLSAIYDREGGSDSRSPMWSGYTRVKGFVEFAESCGAQRRLEIENDSVYLNPRRKELFDGTSGARETHTGVNDDYYIKLLDELLGRKNIGIARLVWRTMSSALPQVLKARYRPNQQYGTKTVPSHLVQTLHGTPWIPGKNGKFYKPSEMTKKRLRDDFEYDDRNGWLTAIGFAEDEQKATNEYRQKKAIAKQLGLTLKDLELIKKIKERPEQYEKIKRQLEELSTPTEFPERPSVDPKRRAQRAKGRAGEAAEKKYEGRKRRVRVSGPASNKVTYLEQSYTNDKNQLVCQMCENEMPFRRRDGRYYFEAVQIFDDLAKEHVAAYLALCPLCAAKFKELIKRDDKHRKKLRDQLASTRGLRIGLDLGKETGNIRFVEKHLLDIQGILAGEEEQKHENSESASS